MNLLIERMNALTPGINHVVDNRIDDKLSHLKMVATERRCENSAADGKIRELVAKYASLWQNTTADGKIRELVAKYASS